TKTVPQGRNDLDFVRERRCEEKPARLGSVFVRVSLEHLGSIMIGIECDRVDENFAAEAVTQRFLNLREVLRPPITELSVALRVHEIDDYSLILDQIIVKLYFLVILGFQDDVGEFVRPLVVRRGLAGSRDRKLPA